MVSNTPIILGIITGILICLYIHNFIQTPSLSNFIEPFIIFGIVFFLIIFIYLSLKNFHFHFIKKMPFYFLSELLFFGFFCYFYFFMIYYFRGIALKKLHIFYLSSIFVFIHILLELSGSYKSFF